MSEFFKGETLQRVVQGKLVQVDAEKELQGKRVAIYFSAHWCPPCRAFTPVLKAFYDKVNENGQSFEIIFVSWDKSPREKMQYMQEAHGSCLTVDNDDDALMNKISSKYTVYGIPTLIAIMDDGNVVNQSARHSVQASNPPNLDDLYVPGAGGWWCNLL